MKKFKDLTAEDFPGVDSNLFYLWKQSLIDANKQMWMALGIILAIIIIVLLTTGMLITPGVLVLLIIELAIYSKPNKLARQAGINRKMIVAARKKKPIQNNAQSM